MFQYIIKSLFVFSLILNLNSYSMQQSASNWASITDKPIEKYHETSDKKETLSDIETNVNSSETHATVKEMFDQLRGYNDNFERVPTRYEIENNARMELFGLALPKYQPLEQETQLHTLNHAQNETKENSLSDIEKNVNSPETHAIAKEMFDPLTRYEIEHNARMELLTNAMQEARMQEERQRDFHNRLANIETINECCPRNLQEFHDMYPNINYTSDATFNKNEDARHYEFDGVVPYYAEHLHISNPKNTENVDTGTKIITWEPYYTDDPGRTSIKRVDTSNINRICEDSPVVYQPTIDHATYKVERDSTSHQEKQEKTDEPPMREFSIESRQRSEAPSSASSASSSSRNTYTPNILQEKQENVWADRIHTPGDIPLSRNTTQSSSSPAYDQPKNPEAPKSRGQRIDITEANFTDPGYSAWLKANIHNMSSKYICETAEKNKTFLEVPEVRKRIAESKAWLDDTLRSQFPIRDAIIKRVLDLHNKAVIDHPEDYTEAHDLVNALTQDLRYHPKVQEQLAKLLKSLPANNRLFLEEEYRDIPAIQNRLAERKNFMAELSIDLDTIPTRGVASQIMSTLTFRDFFTSGFYHKKRLLHQELNRHASQLFPVYDSLNNTQRALIKDCIQASYKYLDLKDIDKAFSASNCLNQATITSLLKEFANENTSTAEDGNILRDFIKANPLMLHNEYVLRKFVNEDNNLLDTFTQKADNKLFVDTVVKDINLWIHPDIQQRVLQLAERPQANHDETVKVNWLSNTIQRQMHLTPEGQRFLETNNISIENITKDLSSKAQVHNQAYLRETVNLLGKYSSEQHKSVTELLTTLAQPNRFTNSQERDKTVTLINLSLRKVMDIRDMLDHVQGPLQKQIDKNQALNFMLETVSDTSKLALHLHEQGQTKQSLSLLQVLSGIYDTATPLIKDSIKDFFVSIPTEKAIQVATFLYPPARIPLIMYSVAKSVAHIYNNIDVLKQDFNEALEAYRNGDSVALGQKITHTANDALTLALATKVVRNAVKVAKAHGIDTNTLSNSFAKRNDRGKNKVTEKEISKLRIPEAITKVIGNFGRYKDADYHHSNSKGHKSPAPKDGQGALNNSVPIKSTSPNRIGVSQNQFVVLSKTSEGEFHGHVRSWDELTREMQQALTKSQMTNAKGKILQDI